MFRIAVVTGLLVLSSASAQTLSSRALNGKDKVHRMEIISGLTQNVRYFGTTLTPDEASTVRELERLENEMAYVRNLIALKQQYVTSERVLEPHRREVQLQLYGVDITQSSYGAATAGFGYYNRLGALPAYTYAGYGGYAAPMVGLGAGFDRTVSYSLANGVGYEGPVKEALSKTLAQQATPEYAASLERSYDRLALRASASPTLRVALGLPRPAETRRERDAIRTVAGEVDRPTAPVVLTLKSGEVVRGKKMTEQKDWIVVDRVGGGRVRIRASEVVRIDETPTGGIRPASD